MSKWQDISTAPKDGTKFIAWDDGFSMMLFTMHWDGEEFLTENESWSGRFHLWQPRPERP